jgi:uncharacterized protein YlzI (FlbEa/FlbD family)
MFYIFIYAESIQDVIYLIRTFLRKIILYTGKKPAFIQGAEFDAKK